MASAKTASAINVRIDDVGSILQFRIRSSFRENSAGFCKSVWLLGSILNFRIGSVSSIGGVIVATLFADTVSDSQIMCPISGREILIELRCWKVLPFWTIQHQRCIKIMCANDPEFYTPLALNCAKGQHLPAPEVYNYQSPRNFANKGHIYFSQKF